MLHHRFHPDRHVPWWIQAQGTSRRKAKASIIVRKFGLIYWRTNLLAARNGQVCTIRREYSDSLIANQTDDAQKDQKRSPESHLGPYPVFQQKKQTLSYTRQSVVPRWQVPRQTHLSSSLTVNTRQFEFSPFSTFSAVLFIPHTNEDP